MSGYVTCFCGLTYSFGGDDGHCPNCGDHASLNPAAHYFTPEEEVEIVRKYDEWLATLPEDGSTRP